MGHTILRLTESDIKNNKNRWPRQNTPRKFFAHLTADTTCASTLMLDHQFLYPFGNTVSGKKLCPTWDQEHGYQLKQNCVGA